MHLTVSDVEALLRPAFPAISNLQVVSLEETIGGLANTNIKANIAGRDNPVLLRLFVRDPQAAQKEFALMSLVKDTVPVPKPIFYAAHSELSGHPYIVMEWVEGARLETVVAHLNAREIEEIGYSLGRTIAAIHSFNFKHCGFFNEKLEIDHPLDMGGSGLFEYAKECLSHTMAAERLGGETKESILNFTKVQGCLLDQWNGKPSLTHADFNGSNILVGKVDERFAVKAILDWEFAFSGTPFFDLGNLLRPPLGGLVGVELAVEKGFESCGQTLPPRWRDMSKLVDLTAWLEFLTRENAGEQLVSDACERIRLTMQQWEPLGNPPVS